MRKFFKVILEIILYIWQLPQNLVGLFLRWIYSQAKNEVIAGIPVYFYRYFHGGISLGKTIIVCKEDEDVVKHEHGHQIQSMYLGPLYLIVIGLPSLIWAGLIYGHIVPKTHNGYYKFYTERSADKLGGVVRY